MLLDSKEDVEKISIHHTPITKKKIKKWKDIEEEIKSQMENDFYENFLLKIGRAHV